MIKENYEYNENVKPNSREIELLKQNFPQYFDEHGNFYWDRFKKVLEDDEIALNKEGYELKFLGKSYARYLSGTKTETFVVPHVEHNEKEENRNSENLYIIGDNIDALKHLLGSYAGKVKCIYIDPPYNTGSDGFVYPDNFYFDAKKLSEMIGVEEEEAERIINLKGKSSHSAWLTFMYPRLILARELLSDDGVIFISIDDNEQANLKLMCDEVFGEDNFNSIFPRVTKRGGKSSEVIAKNHDYLLIYSKTSQSSLYPIEHDDSDFKYSDEFFDERGYFKLNQTLDYDSLQYSKSLDYPIEIDNEVFYPGTSKVAYEERQAGIHDNADWAWRWSKSKFDFGYKNGFVVVKKSRNGKRIYTKTYQKATIEEGVNGYYIDFGERKKSLSTLEMTENIYSNDNATKDIAQVIDKKLFDHTKAISLISLVGRLSTKNEDIILDFFSGFRVIIMTVANSLRKSRVPDALPMFGTREYMSLSIL